MERKYRVMPQRWALRLAITGELRYLSHLDCVRAIERTAARAETPMRFSQGFNPHPVLSLAMARPVGVAALDDLAVLTLDEPTDGAELAERMNKHAPKGMRLDRPRRLESRRTPRPTRITYEVCIDDEQRREANERISVLLSEDAWPIERVKISKDRKHRSRTDTRKFDARRLVEEMAIDDSAGVFRWTCVPDGDLWLRVNEIMSLVGMTARGDVARVTRTTVEYDY